MEFTGRISRMLPLQSGTSQNGNSWKRQDFIFEYVEHDTDRWSDKVLLSVMNDRIEEYDLHEGDEVKIGFSHNVREYNMKVFNELRVYKIEKLASAPQMRLSPVTPSADATPAPASQEQTQEKENDDLPF